MREKITDKQTYLNRRLFMQAAVLAGTASASTLLYRRLNPPPAEPVKREKLDAAADTSKNEAEKNGYVVEDKLTPLEAITNYNNFYEFDALCTDLGVEKIKTIGDAYLAVAGLDDATGEPAAAVCDLAL